MASTHDPSMASVKELDDIIIEKTNKHNAEVTSIDPDSEDNNTPAESPPHGSSKTGSSLTGSPFTRIENGNIMPSPEVFNCISTIAGIDISGIPLAISGKVKDILTNLEAMCSSSHTSAIHCDQYMNNMKTIFDLEIEVAQTLRSKIRKDTALGIVEKQQFRDLWGSYVFNQSKTNGCVCYLCGLPIVPEAPPEMEHKIPSPVMFTTIMHYRQMTMFYADEPIKSQDSVYTRWHRFINTDMTNRIKLLKLYKLINGGHTSDRNPNDYPKDGIDTLFSEIFKAFLSTIPYIKRKGKGDFFRYLIKYWLLEFAYSHHLCNQAKSDLPICHTSPKYYNAFSRSVEKRLQNKENDSKTKQEANIIGGVVKVVNNIINRKPRTCAMFEHMEETRTNILNAYTTISEVFDGSCDGYQKMISVMVVRSMLALLKRNEISLDQGANSSIGVGNAIEMASSSSSDKVSYSESDPYAKEDADTLTTDELLEKVNATNKRARMDESGKTTDETITESNLETIGDLKITIDELEDEINELKKGPSTRNTTGQLEHKQADLASKQAELESRQALYEELNKPINEINDEQDNSLIRTIMRSLENATAGCVISGGKRRKTRRRRMGKRSRARRSSRSGSKKTRKRMARKTARKRRSK